MEDKITLGSGVTVTKGYVLELEQYNEMLRKQVSVLYYNLELYKVSQERLQVEITMLRGEIAFESGYEDSKYQGSDDGE